MPTYPDYVYQTLALFPACTEAGDLGCELFCDEWTIYENRVAVQQQVDEWDGRPSDSP